MTRQRGAVRVVAVTGAAGPVGSAVAAGLRRAIRTGRVIGVDAAAPDPAVLPADHGVESGVEWRSADIASPAVARALEGADVVVHIAAPDDLEAELAVPADERRDRAVRAVQAVGTAAAAVGARHLVVVSSAMVHGASPDNPVPLPDDAPLLDVPDDGLVGDLLEVERVLERFPRVHPGLALTVVRPAALVGPGVDTMITRHFEAPRLLLVRGASAQWQFCHVDDLAEAVATVITEKLTGPVTVGCEGVLPEADLERLSGLRRLEVPPGIAFATAERLHRLGVLPLPGSDLAYVVHPWVVGSQRLRDAGWRPRHDNAECVATVVSGVAHRQARTGRRVDRRDAALGAAGAAVALMGTAAILRQARSRRRDGGGRRRGDDA